MEDSLLIIKQAEEMVESAGDVLPEPAITPILSPYFTIAALVLSLLCVGLVFFLFVYCRKLKKTDNDIKNIVLSSLRRRDGQISQAVIDLVQEDIVHGFSRHERPDINLTRKEIEKIVQMELKQFLNERQDVIYSSKEPERNLLIENMSQSSVLLSYASTVNKEKNCFYEVTKTPNSDTVFVLELNPENKNEAMFTVYYKVFKKVIQEQGHINGGCVIENSDMNNTSIVKTIEPGVAQLVDGRWFVEVKAKVKFE